MKGGRKNLRRACEESALSLQQGQSIMRVESLRGSNVIEVMDGKGVKSLAIFPAKFQRSFWIKRGSFVVVDESGREQALESGSKIACMVSQVLFHDQVRTLEKSPEWPAIFRTSTVDDSKAHIQRPASDGEELSNSDEEDGLPPLEANMNRNRPIELHSDSDHSDSDADS
ncbi:putative RNA-binding protein [Ananas comosus]|uniref:S1-like domain-containing protein n=2 Tax=Ananas comosus TaxID=4615 RepID=A0A6V7QSB6_ANACO|nr:putative RNA-binding protein [Ananas comosus]